MKVEMTVCVRTDEGHLLARQDRNIKATLHTLRNCIKWPTLGLDIAAAALNQAKEEMDGMGDPDA